MTFEEWQKAHYVKCGFISSTTELRLAWDAAVAAERERCAQWLEAMAARSPDGDTDRDALLAAADELRRA